MENNEAPEKTNDLSGEPEKKEETLHNNPLLESQDTTVTDNSLHKKEVQTQKPLISNPETKQDVNYPFIDQYNKKLFNNARSVAVKILVRCERTDAYLDKLIDSELRQSELNDLDKALLNELSHGVIRWMRRLDWFLNGFYRGQYEKCLPDVKNAMRVALYQILFLNKIPYAAAVNEAVEFIKKIRGDRHAGVVNGLLRTIIRTLDSLVWPTREIDEVNYLGIVQSHPNWLVRRWINRFGFDAAEKLCEANNKRPGITMRLNKTKLTAEDFEKYLTDKNIKFYKGKYLDYFYSTKSMSRIYDDDYFKKGYFTIQDESAGFVAHLADPKENEIIIDVCAAPGGKSSHIAELANNKSKLIAVDKYLSKVEMMKKNFDRLALKQNILVFHEDINEPKTELMREKLIGKADKVIADVPCSGFGVLSKKPDIKWKRDSEDIIKLQKLQVEIIEKAVLYVKPGGSLIYSTCTTEKEENIDVVNIFLENHRNFRLINASEYVSSEVVSDSGCVEVFPHIHGIDGSFSARLERFG